MTQDEVEAELHDGTVLKFPAGTRVDKVSSEVKKHLASRPKPAEPQYDFSGMASPETSPAPRSFDFRAPTIPGRDIADWAGKKLGVGSTAKGVMHGVGGFVEDMSTPTSMALTAGTAALGGVGVPGKIVMAGLSGDALRRSAKDIGGIPADASTEDRASRYTGAGLNALLAVAPWLSGIRGLRRSPAAAPAAPEPVPMAPPAAEPAPVAPARAAVAPRPTPAEPVPVPAPQAAPAPRGTPPAMPVGEPTPQRRSLRAELARSSPSRVPAADQTRPTPEWSGRPAPSWREQPQLPTRAPSTPAADPVPTTPGPAASAAPRRGDWASQRSAPPSQAPAGSSRPASEMVPGTAETSRAGAMNDAVDSRMSEMSDLFESELGGLSGKAKYAAQTESSKGGFGKIGLKRAFPELSGIKESPGRIAEAIRKDGDNPLYLEVKRRIGAGVESEHGPAIESYAEGQAERGALQNEVGDDTFDPSRWQGQEGFARMLEHGLAKEIEPGDIEKFKALNAERRRKAPQPLPRPPASDFDVANQRNYDMLEKFFSTDEPGKKQTLREALRDMMVGTGGEEGFARIRDEDSIRPSTRSDQLFQRYHDASAKFRELVDQKAAIPREPRDAARKMKWEAMKRQVDAAWKDVEDATAARIAHATKPESPGDVLPFKRSDEGFARMKDEGREPSLGDVIRVMRYGRPVERSTNWVDNTPLDGMSAYRLDESGKSTAPIRGEFADRDSAHIGAGKLVGYGPDGEPLVSGFEGSEATQAQREMAEYGMSREDYLKAPRTEREIELEKKFRGQGGFARAKDDRQRGLFAGPAVPMPEPKKADPMQALHSEIAGMENTRRTGALRDVIGRVMQGSGSWAEKRKQLGLPAAEVPISKPEVDAILKRELGGVQ